VKKESSKDSKPEYKPPQSSVVKVGKIKEIKNSVEGEIYYKKEQMDVKIISSPENLPLINSKDNVIKFLNEIADLFLEQNKKIVGAYLKKPLVEVENGVIVFTISSQFIQNSLENDFRWIRLQAQNRGFYIDSLKFIYDVKKVEEYNPVTPQQQFEVLAKQYPLLAELKNRFGLVIE
jgi:hypothetical protein